MKLYTFQIDEEPRIGAEHNGLLVDLSAAYEEWMLSTDARGPILPSDMMGFLHAWPEGVAAARRAVAFAAERTSPLGGRQLAHAFREAKLLAPLPRPGKILCSGVNYRGHLEENPQARLPETPFFFSKLPSVVIGPGEPIVHPSRTRQLDYEVELAVVLGRTLRRASEEEAMAAVAGYTILHDVSARDVQFQDQQITLGKNFDTFAPMGPCLLTADEVPDPGNLRLRTYLNGRLMQDGSTRDWVFPLPRLLSFLSGVMTLEPGDVVSTGTPAGVGVFRKPPVFLKPGDVVALEVQSIGRLENPVVAA